MAVLHYATGDQAWSFLLTFLVPKVCQVFTVGISSLKLLRACVAPSSRQLHNELFLYVSGNGRVP